jgi:hypothetical protein
MESGENAPEIKTTAIKSLFKRPRNKFIWLDVPISRADSAVP